MVWFSVYICPGKIFVKFNHPKLSQRPSKTANHKGIIRSYNEEELKVDSFSMKKRDAQNTVSSARVGNRKEAQARVEIEPYVVHWCVIIPLTIFGGEEGQESCGNLDPRPLTAFRMSDWMVE